MGLTRKHTKAALLGAALYLAVPPVTLQGQEAKEAKEPPTPEKIAEWKKESEALTLFTGDAPLAVTLVGNFKEIAKDRDTLSTTEYWGELRVADDQGGEAKFAVKLRTRGHYRLIRRNCAFVPLRLNFVKKEVKGTVFDGQDKMKLVTHCNSNSMYDEYVVREYLAQKVHSIVTPHAFRSRLAKVTYVDSATGTAVETRNGILMEHEDDVARRMEGEIAELRQALFDDVDARQINEVAIFEAFIGNTDWSLAALHNIRLVRRQDGTILPVAYDLDFSGLVGTRYATPDPRLGIRNVKERLYRGPCRPLEELEPIFSTYLSKEAEILKLYEGAPGLDGRYRQDATSFLNQWFKMLKSPRDLKWMFVDNCKNVPGV
ncbi:MAG TPA: hypothetical protein VF981_10660 [Gemmatimonadaceae bacterium]